VESDVDPAGNIQRLTASVIIAPRYEGTGSNRRAVPRSAEELANFRSIVRDAIGIREDDPTRNDQITVIEQEFETETLRELSREVQRRTLRQYWTEIALRLVYPALGSDRVDAFLARLAQSAGNRDSAGSAGWQPGTGRCRERERQRQRQRRWHPRVYAGARGLEPKVVTVEVLNQLIRENPANMTQAVRTWLTRGNPAS
jgi:flagellar biosynthesis/type III secretory pathway M-ring protein FliF/YscJ